MVKKVNQEMMGKRGLLAQMVNLVLLVQRACLVNRVLMELMDFLVLLAMMDLQVRKDTLEKKVQRVHVVSLAGMV